MVFTIVSWQWWAGWWWSNESIGAVALDVTHSSCNSDHQDSSSSDLYTIMDATRNSHGDTQSSAFPDVLHPLLMPQFSRPNKQCTINHVQLLAASYFRPIPRCMCQLRNIREKTQQKEGRKSATNVARWRCTTVILTTSVKRWGAIENVTILMIIIREDAGGAGNFGQEIWMHAHVPPQEEIGILHTVCLHCPKEI